MDHKLLLQLLQNKTEEIQSLLSHFRNNPDELETGYPLLADRIESLSKEFDLMKTGFSDKSLIKNEEPKATAPTVETNEKEDHVIFEPKKNEDIKSEQEEIIVEEDNVVEMNSNSELTESDNEAILNDQLQTQSSGVIGEKLNNGKLEDIQSAIGINDRFLFIRELFENNADAYTECINFINQTNDFTAIVNHFKNNTEWDFENPTVIQFLELTKRKF